MGQLCILRRDGRNEVRLELRRRQVIITAYGEDTTQDFPSEAAAKEHFERLLLLRTKEGFVVTEKRDTGDVADRGPAEQLFLKTVESENDEVKLKLSLARFGGKESEALLVEILSTPALQRAASLTLERDSEPEYEDVEDLPLVAKALAISFSSTSTGRSASAISALSSERSRASSARASRETSRSPRRSRTRDCSRSSSATSRRTSRRRFLSRRCRSCASSSCRWRRTRRRKTCCSRGSPPSRGRASRACGFRGSRKVASSLRSSP